MADAAATSDSDLLTFRCPLTLYGHLMGGKKPGAMVKWGSTCSKRINELTVEELVSVTCLTGCDYINRLKGMSLKQAIDIVISWRGKVCIGVIIILLCPIQRVCGCCVTESNGGPHTPHGYGDGKIVAESIQPRVF